MEKTKNRNHFLKVDSVMSNNANRQFIDIKWLAVFGLTKENALEYFYTSDFYDAKSNNEIIRSQGVSLGHLTTMIGVEYALDLEYSKEPHLFVINKVYRRSPKEVDLIEVFYCIDGIIYKCPCLLDLLRVRVAQISYNARASFKELNDSIEYNSSYGHRLNVETSEAFDPKEKAEKMTAEDVHPKVTIDDIFKSTIPYKNIPNFSKPLAVLKSDQFN